MTLPGAVGQLFHFLLDQFAPRRCPGCDREQRGASAFCTTCSTALAGPVRVGLPLIAEPATEALPVRTLGPYRPPLSTAIRRIKYERRADLVQPLVAAWLDAHPEVREVRVDRLVPVPLHPRKLVARGFNQSALVASQLARRLGIARAPRLLRKVIETPSQASLSREQRLTNFSDAFSTDRKARPGQRVILIDDVVTTGATVSACIRALAAANLGVVEIWALSHTPFESRP